jgi:hypothetical protein
METERAWLASNYRTADQALNKKRIYHRLLSVEHGLTWHVGFSYRGKWEYNKYKYNRNNTTASLMMAPFEADLCL